MNRKKVLAFAFGFAFPFSVAVYAQTILICGATCAASSPCDACNAGLLDDTSCAKTKVRCYLYKCDPSSALFKFCQKDKAPGAHLSFCIRMNDINVTCSNCMSWPCDCLSTPSGGTQSCWLSGPRAGSPCDCGTSGTPITQLTLKQACQPYN